MNIAQLLRETGLSNYDTDTMMNMAEALEIYVNVNVPADQIKANLVIINSKEKKLVTRHSLSKRERPEIKGGTQAEYWANHHNPWLD